MPEDLEELSLNDIVSKDYNSLITEYVNATTSSNFPFINKIKKAYLISLYSSDDLTSVLESLNNFTNPFKNIMVPREFSPLVDKYQTGRYLEIINFSLIRKDLNLFKITCNAIFPLGYELKYGLLYSSGVISNTDEIVEKFTDQEYFTDMIDNANFLLNILVDYSLTTEGPYIYRKDLINILVKNLEFFSIIKPALS